MVWYGMILCIHIYIHCIYDRGILVGIELGVVWSLFDLQVHDFRSMTHMGRGLQPSSAIECHRVPSGVRSCDSAPDWSAPFDLYQLAMPVRRVRSKLRSCILKFMMFQYFSLNAVQTRHWFHAILIHLWDGLLATCAGTWPFGRWAASCSCAKEGRLLQTSMLIWRSRACYPLRQAWNRWNFCGM